MEPRSTQMSKGFEVGEIKDVVIRDLRKFKDARGWLAELFRRNSQSEVRNLKF